jgi:hypothetical protein
MAIVTKQKVDEKEKEVVEQEVVGTPGVEDVIELVDILPVKHIVRVISAGAPINGAVPVEEVNKYLAEQYKQGYSLFDTHYLGIQPEGYAMMWILVAK